MSSAERQRVRTAHKMTETLGPRLSEARLYQGHMPREGRWPFRLAVLAFALMLAIITSFLGLVLLTDGIDL